MKNILILTIILFFYSLSSFAQKIVPLEEQFDYEYQGEPYYYKDVNNLLDKFTGEWEFTDATHYLKIKFYKIEGINESASPKETYDEIRSFILYKEKQAGKWIVVYNTYPSSYTTADLNNQNFNNGFGIKGNYVDETNYNRLILSYYEPTPPCTLMITCLFSLTFINTTNPQIDWKLNQHCYLESVSQPCSSTNNPIQEYKIPLQLTLTKL